MYPADIGTRNVVGTVKAKRHSDCQTRGEVGIGTSGYANHLVELIDTDPRLAGEQRVSEAKIGGKREGLGTMMSGQTSQV